MSQAIFVFVFGVFFCLSGYGKDFWIHEIEPSVGSGNGSLSMTLEAQNEEIRYDATNKHYTFVSLGYRGFSAQVKFPSRDSIEERMEKGDSKVTDYQLSFELSKRWHLEFFYQRYKGYYTEREGFTYILPDLSLANTGGQLVYVANPEFALSMLNSAIWEQKKTAWSTYFAVGLNHYDLEGDLAPVKMRSVARSDLRTMSVDSLTVRPGIGKNWIWSHWYAGAGISYNVHMNQVRYSFKNQDEDEFDLQSSASIGLGGGYQWTKTKLGMYVRSYTWKVKFSDQFLTASTELVGLYLSSFF